MAAEKETGPPTSPAAPAPLVGPLLGLVGRLAPLLVLAALVGVPAGVLAYQQLQLEPPEGTRTVRIEAYQWGFDPANITIKKGERVRLLATSRDVTHGLYLQGYNIDLEVHPGKWTEVEFTADLPGTFTMRCSVLCAAKPELLNHFQMTGRLVVEQDRSRPSGGQR